MLQRAQLVRDVDLIMGNEDVDFPKPNPEIYLKAFKSLGVSADECVIVEDSEVGKQAAYASGSNVCEVEGPDDVNFYKVLAAILDAQEVNIVIPASGYGKRFAEAGYLYPKPLIDVAGTPMLSLVLDTVKGIGRVITIMRDEHIANYCVPDILYHLNYGVEVITEFGTLQGAATSVLIAKPYIDSNNELIIANSDQYLAPPIIHNFLSRMRVLGADGGMITFDAEDKKWSYAREENGLVVEVAEKNPISRNATAGVYYYRRGKDFVRWGEQMINKNIRVNNEFYVCPVFNEAIADGAKIYTHAINPKEMHGLGTPEDLEAFLE